MCRKELRYHSRPPLIGLTLVGKGPKSGLSVPSLEVRVKHTESLARRPTPACQCCRECHGGRVGPWVLRPVVCEIAPATSEGEHVERTIGLADAGAKTSNSSTPEIRKATRGDHFIFTRFPPASISLNQ